MLWWVTLLVVIVGGNIFPKYARRSRPTFVVSPDITCPTEFLADYFAPWADFTRRPTAGAAYSIREARVQYGTSSVEAVAQQVFPNDPTWIGIGCKVRIDVNKMGCGPTFKGVILHEIGHCLGLAHSPHPGSMMNFSVLVGADGRVLEPPYDLPWMAAPSIWDKLDLYRVIE